MDQIINDWFAHLKSRHRVAKYVSDMPKFAEASGLTYFEGGFSIATRDGRIQVRRNAHPIKRREDAAHEIVHALGDEKGFEELVRNYHISVEIEDNIDDHIENIVDHGMGIILMPDSLVNDVVGEFGWTARSVHELSEYGWVSPQTALRHLAFYREGVSCAGFISKGNYVQFATGNYYHPFYDGQRMPEPHIREDSGISLYAVPESRIVIGFLELANDGA